MPARANSWIQRELYGCDWETHGMEAGSDLLLLRLRTVTGGMKGSILLQGEVDSRVFKGKYDEKSNHLRNF